MTTAPLNPAALRNRGVPVDVAVVRQPDDGSAPHVVTDQDGDPHVEQIHVRFDANALADLEEEYGSLDKFDEAAKEIPIRTVRKALAIAWGVSPRLAGLRMLDGRINDYSTALGVALALANGVDPLRASTLLQVGIKASADAVDAMNTQIDRMLAETTDDSPGTSGSEPGSSSANGSTTSGDTARPRSTSSSNTAPAPAAAKGEQEGADGAERLVTSSP